MKEMFKSAIHIIIMDNNKILLQKRKGSKLWPGYYALPAGHIDKGENQYEALIREAKEELNKKKSDTKKIFSKHLSKIEDSINEAKEKLGDKREARDKEKLEKYIDNRLEYTSDCISLALTLASEAKLSFLEALEAQAELDEK